MRREGGRAPTLQLFQTEWCPASARVRERLTEHCIDYVIRQVPVEREARVALREATAADTIPALVLEDGTALVGEEAIGAYLDERVPTTREADAHRLKAARVHRRTLEEECECARAPTR